jgi:MFS family permease
MPRRVIQVFMGVALLLAAGFFTMTNLGVIPPTGSAMGLAGWRFALAVVANFVLGALMCVGVGNYAPSMALLAFLGMHPIAAYPIMIASDGVLIPVASLGFLRTGRFAPAVAVGLTLGGIVGTIAAFPLVKMLGDHLTLMRWAVTGVIAYAAIAMLRSARASQPGADSARIEFCHLDRNPSVVNGRYRTIQPNLRQFELMHSRRNQKPGASGRACQTRMAMNSCGGVVRFYDPSSAHDGEATQQ